MSRVSPSRLGQRCLGSVIFDFFQEVFQSQYLAAGHHRTNGYPENPMEVGVLPGEIKIGDFGLGHHRGEQRFMEIFPDAVEGAFRDACIVAVGEGR